MVSVAALAPHVARVPTFAGLFLIARRLIRVPQRAPLRSTLRRSLRATHRLGERLNG
jgi:hypothetical protein